MASIELSYIDEGCEVTIVGMDAGRVATTARELAEETGRRVEPFAADLREAAGCLAAAQAHEAAFGHLDVLVNCAGATRSGDFLDLADEVWEDGFALKFYACMRLSRALWPLLTASGGSVVNVIGAASKTPNPNFAIGGAVNAAMTSLSKSLAGLGLRDGVQVNAVHPGPVTTDRLTQLLDQRAQAAGMSREDYERKEVAESGIRAYSRPEDVADLVCFLASPLARQVHGADVFVDGGMTKSIL